MKCKLRMLRKQSRHWTTTRSGPDAFLLSQNLSTIADCGWVIVHIWHVCQGDVTFFVTFFRGLWHFCDILWGMWHLLWHFSGGCDTICDIFVTNFSLSGERHPQEPFRGGNSWRNGEIDFGGARHHSFHQYNQYLYIYNMINIYLYNQYNQNIFIQYKTINISI